MDERDLLRDYVTRRGKGEPLQYITGEVGFRHIAVKVRPGVLIPRPETEVLVSEALALLPPACRPRATDSRMTDAEAEALLAAARRGKGLRPRRPKTAWAVVPGDAPARRRTAVSGGEPEPLAAIPSGAPKARSRKIFCKDGRPSANACWWPTSARARAASPAPSPTSIRSRTWSPPTWLPKPWRWPARTWRRWGSPAAWTWWRAIWGRASTRRFWARSTWWCPIRPYVPTAVMAEVPREVADFEPALALDGGPDGLDVFRRLVPWCARALRPGGAFAFELHETCLDAAAALARDAGFSDVCIVNDLAGRPRVLTARRG